MRYMESTALALEDPRIYIEGVLGAPQVGTDAGETAPAGPLNPLIDGITNGQEDAQ